MLKVLITGGAGFIGGALAEALANQGNDVHILDSFARGRRDSFLERLLSRENVTLHTLDLLEPNALSVLDSDFTHVFHFAAILGVQKVLDEPYSVLRDNVLLLEPVIEFARRQCDLQRLVFASTSEIYAGSLEHMDMPLPTPESTPLALPGLERPRTSYMLSKIYGEAMVRHAGLPFTIVRPHNVYGPRMGQKHVVPQLLQKAFDAPSGASIEVFSVSHRRTFCFIDDAVEMLIRTATSASCTNQVLNLGTQAPEITIRKLAEIVIASVGKELSIDAAPETAGSPVRRCPDMQRMAELTGYQSVVGPEEGVARTYDWYRDYVFEGDATKVAS